MNQAVFLAMLEPGDTFMGLDLNSGGHLTHGSPVNMSGKWFNPVSYGVRQDNELIDMNEVMALAKEHKPKLIIAGGTAYSRSWDWEAFRKVADEVGAYLMVDMSHISGLVAGGAHANPFPHAHVVTSTTHKSLRGPRSGVILWNDEKYSKPLNMAVFPGLQGGPLMHIVAAKAVAFREALRPDFKDYAARVVENARALAASLEDNGLRIVSGGTDNHSMLVDLTAKDVTGKDAEKGLDRAYLTCNKNGIPFDKRSPFVTSGLRLGSPAGTTRGFGPDEFTKIGELIARVVEGLAKNGPEGDAQIEQAVRAEVGERTTLHEKLEQSVLDAALVHQPDYWPGMQVEQFEYSGCDLSTSGCTTDIGKRILNVDETWLGMCDFRRRKWRPRDSFNSVPSRASSISG